MSESPTTEAARYRRRLREVEAERDRLAAHVEHLQRGIIEQLLEAERVGIDALTATGATLDGLLDGDGLPDPHKVRQAAQTARMTLGVPGPLYVPQEGALPPRTSTRTFLNAFKETR